MYLSSDPSSDDYTPRPVSPVINIFPSPPNSDFEFASSPLHESHDYFGSSAFNNSEEYNCLTYSFSNLTFSDNDNSSDYTSPMLKLIQIPEISVSSANLCSTEEQSEEANEDKFGIKNNQFHTDLQKIENERNKNKNREPTFQRKTQEKQSPKTKVLLFKSSIKKEKDSISTNAPNTFLQNQPVSKFFKNVEIKNEHHLKQEILIQPIEEQFEDVKKFETDFNQMIQNTRSLFKTNYHSNNTHNNSNSISNKINFLSPPTPLSQLPKPIKTSPKKSKSKSKSKPKSARSKLKNNIANLNITITTSPLSIESSNLIQKKNENENENENEINYSSLNSKNNIILGPRKRTRRRSSRRIASSYKHLSKPLIPIHAKQLQPQSKSKLHAQTTTLAQAHPKGKSKARARNTENKNSDQKILQPLVFPSNSKEMIKFGKSVYKVLIGTLWVIFGGPSQTQVSPYSQKFGNQISKMFDVSERNINSTPLALKNLLSNSRRTFAEFILEILVGVLSLCYLNKPPGIALQLRQTLKEITIFQKNHPTKEILTKNLKSCDNEKQMGLINQLNDLYSQLFVEDVLMFWFEKRFTPKAELRLKATQRTQFYSQYISIIGSHFFQRCCNLLAPELMKESNDTITPQYFRLINLSYQSSPLNCYYNNRMGKAKLITKLIVKFSVNKGAYWDEIVHFFSKRVHFNLENILLTSPFNYIMNLPLVQKNIQKNINNQKVNSPLTRNAFNACFN
ncbi:hypothetical protein M0813_25535 [Anaeramoeba flamelloides]|uniref:Uncharacterized protein n=1 Tax=Anaeramoeba flamelloides TaxID=1746091 RepID=A0ABQ8Y444_9EUKA|nr:hypothetical protein M0813_25535 [Anaeramoeba flamelloides]